MTQKKNWLWLPAAFIIAVCFWDIFRDPASLLRTLYGRTLLLAMAGIIPLGLVTLDRSRVSPRRLRLLWVLGTAAELGLLVNIMNFTVLFHRGLQWRWHITCPASLVVLLCYPVTCGVLAVLRLRGSRTAKPVLLGLATLLLGLYVAGYGLLTLAFTWRTEEIVRRDGQQVVEIHRSALGQPITEYAPYRGPIVIGWRESMDD